MILCDVSCLQSDDAYIDPDKLIKTIAEADTDSLQTGHLKVSALFDLGATVEPAFENMVRF